MAIRMMNLLLLLTVSCATSAWAQSDLQRAKDLYAAAAYEEALAVLSAVPNADRTPQVGQYRVFCLIALGQGDEADLIIRELLESDPLYQPDPGETPPRVLEAFADVRTRALPSIARQIYVDAKAALERKEREVAVTGFQRLLRTIDGAPELASEFEDLRVLADGFLTLSRALPEPPKVAEPEVTSPTATNGAASDASPSVASTRPVAIKQDIPPWFPYDGVSRLREFTGLLRVRVDANGRVQSADMIQRIHPAYDRLLLRATESWLYEPATENGVPVPTDVVIQIQLRPPS